MATEVAFDVVDAIAEEHVEIAYFAALRPLGATAATLPQGEAAEEDNTPVGSAVLVEVPGRCGDTTDVAVHGKNPFRVASLLHAAYKPTWASVFVPKGMERTVRQAIESKHGLIVAPNYLDEVVSEVVGSPTTQPALMPKEARGMPITVRGATSEDFSALHTSVGEVFPEFLTSAYGNTEARHGMDALVAVAEGGVEGEVVSVVYAVPPFRSTVHLFAYTVAAWRRHGIAKGLVSTWMSRGQRDPTLTYVWRVLEDNLGGQQLAETLGFEEVTRHVRLQITTPVDTIVEPTRGSTRMLPQTQPVGTQGEVAAEEPGIDERDEEDPAVTGGALLATFRESGILTDEARGALTCRFVGGGSGEWDDCGYDENEDLRAAVCGLLRDGWDTARDLSLLRVVAEEESRHTRLLQFPTEPLRQVLALLAVYGSVEDAALVATTRYASHDLKGGIDVRFLVPGDSAVSAVITHLTTVGGDIATRAVEDLSRVPFTSGADLCAWRQETLVEAFEGG